VFLRPMEHPVRYMEKLPGFEVHPPTVRGGDVVWFVE
jgi:hypothetical protein